MGQTRHLPLRGPKGDKNILAGALIENIVEYSLTCTRCMVAVNSGDLSRENAIGGTCSARASLYAAEVPELA